MVGDALDFSAWEWTMIVGGGVLTLVAIVFVVTIWLAAMEVHEYYRRENRRHRGEE